MERPVAAHPPKRNQTPDKQKQITPTCAIYRHVTALTVTGRITANPRWTVLVAPSRSHPYRCTHPQPHTPTKSSFSAHLMLIIHISWPLALSPPLPLIQYVRLIPHPHTMCSLVPFLSRLVLHRSPDIDDCHVIVNDKSTEFMLATVVEEAGKYVPLTAVGSSSYSLVFFFAFFAECFVLK